MKDSKKLGKYLGSKTVKNGKVTSEENQICEYKDSCQIASTDAPVRSETPNYIGASCSEKKDKQVCAWYPFEEKPSPDLELGITSLQEFEKEKVALCLHCTNEECKASGICLRTFTVICPQCKQQKSIKGEDAPAFFEHGCLTCAGCAGAEPSPEELDPEELDQAIYNGLSDDQKTPKVFKEYTDVFSLDEGYEALKTLPRGATIALHEDYDTLTQQPHPKTYALQRGTFLLAAREKGIAVVLDLPPELRRKVMESALKDAVPLEKALDMGVGWKEEKRMPIEMGEGATETRAYYMQRGKPKVATVFSLDEAFEALETLNEGDTLIFADPKAYDARPTNAYFQGYINLVNKVFDKRVNLFSTMTIIKTVFSLDEAIKALETIPEGSTIIVDEASERNLNFNSKSYVAKRHTALRLAAHKKVTLTFGLSPELRKKLMERIRKTAVPLDRVQEMGSWDEKSDAVLKLLPKKIRKSYKKSLDYVLHRLGIAANARLIDGLIHVYETPEMPYAIDALNALFNPKEKPKKTHGLMFITCPKCESVRLRLEYKGKLLEGSANMYKETSKGKCLQCGYKPPKQEYTVIILSGKR